jgi:hypothetical protein
MSKPRIFISSTCFDLRDARARLTEFLQGFGFEVLNSQTPSFAVTPKTSAVNACLDQVDLADYLILIIGNRSGTVREGVTVTNAEYNRAMERGIPVIPFVQRTIFDSLPIYKDNPLGDFTAVVDNVRIFDFIEVIASGKQDNWLHPFESVTDIEERLRAQFAYYLFLYSQRLGRAEDHDAAKVLKTIRFFQDQKNAYYRELIESLFGDMDIAMRNVMKAASFPEVVQLGGGKLEIINDAAQLKSIVQGTGNASSRQDNVSRPMKARWGTLIGHYAIYPDRHIVMDDIARRQFEDRQQQLRILMGRK